MASPVEAIPGAFARTRDHADVDVGVAAGVASGVAAGQPDGVSAPGREVRGHGARHLEHVAIDGRIAGHRRRL
jgi:hypothetical protein